MTCDGCGKQDVHLSGNSVDYYLRLENRKCGMAGGGAVALTDAMVYPSLGRGSLYFCGLECLALWMKETHPYLLGPGACENDE